MEAEEAPLIVEVAAEEGVPKEEEEEGRIGGNNLVMLTERAQLQRLALVLRNTEEPLMRQVIKSEQERVQYLNTVNDAYNQTRRLLDDCTALRDTHERSSQSESHALRLQVARDVHDYVIYGLNLCMQNVRNCCMRVDAIAKLRAHYDALADGLAEDAAGDLESLAAEASQYRASMWEYCHSHRSASARAHSRAYSRVLLLEGIDFAELTRRHQLRLGYGGKGEDFEDLEDTQKLEVYNSIIVESGRAKIPLLAGLAGRKIISAKTWGNAVGVFIMAAGNMVWDVFTAEHNVEAVLRGSLNVMAAVGAFAVDVAVTGAVTKAVASLGAGLFATSLAGFVVGAIAGLIFVAVSGRLIDLIFGSPNKVPPVAELKFHTAVMPDGMSLAISIARQTST